MCMYIFPVHAPGSNMKVNSTCLSMCVWSMVSSYTLIPTRLTGPFVTFNIKHKPLITMQLTSNHKWHVVEQYVVSTPTEKTC